MTPRSISHGLILATLVLLPALAGCSTTPPPRLFTLAPQPAAPAGQLARIISVKRVAIAKYLDRLQIVRYRDSYELSYSEFTLWGEGLGDMVTRVLVEDLSTRLPRSQVYAASGPLTAATPDITVEVNIDRFDTDPGGTVVLAAQWIAHRQGKSDQIRSERIEVAPASGDATGQVAAMSDTLGQFAGRIATGLSAAP